MSQDRIEVDGVIFTRSTPITSTEKGFEANFGGFEPEVRILPKGYVHKKGFRALPCDVIYERDVAVELRDGTTIYTDVFRPAAGGPVPAIIAWSPYGKNGCGATHLEGMPGRMGVSKKAFSTLNKWEAPDPAYWCGKGYAVCNPDARGAFMSEGNIQYWGRQEAEDAYDYIEWIASQEWCSGKTALAGNSWLAISQWHIAALRPPHLTAIAPWEGNVFLYSEDLVRGGIPSLEFCEYVIKNLFGNNYTENVVEMARLHPLYDDYWKSKMPDLSAVEVPAYVVSSWSNQVHTKGTFAGWRGISSKDKWLRVHNTQEWFDFYQDENVEDLRRFFDFYLKGEKNGWDSTPRIRLSVLDFGGVDTVNRVEESFPLERAVPTRLFLDAASMTLVDAQPGEHAEASYDSEDKAAAKAGVAFEMAFDRDVEIVGYPKLRVWVESRGHDDMDVFVYVQKLDANGRQLIQKTVRTNELPWKLVFKFAKIPAIEYTGPDGRLRVSLRALDEAASTDEEPVLRYDSPEKLSPGQVVPVEIPLWPTGMAFHKGERLRLLIAGTDIKEPALPGIEPACIDNSGRHVFHTGGQYDSYLQVPVIERR